MEAESRMAVPRHWREQSIEYHEHACMRRKDTRQARFPRLCRCWKVLWEDAVTCRWDEMSMEKKSPRRFTITAMEFTYQQEERSKGRRLTGTVHVQMHP